MNKIYTLIIISLCFSVFISCKRESGYIPELSKAESLLDKHPDRAMHILHALNKNKVKKDEAVRMNYYLLLYQAEDRCEIDHTSDSIMLDVVHYYEKNKYGDRLMRAYYQLGRVYDDMQDSPEALKYYHKAIDLSSTSKSYSTIGRIYSQIGNVCGAQGIFDEEISADKKAYEYYLTAKDSSMIACALRDLCFAYFDLNKIDKASTCFRQAYSIALKIKNQQKENDIISSYIDELLELNRYKEAYHYLLQIKNVTDTNTIANIYSAWTTYYQQTGHNDSAVYYGNKALSIGSIYVKYEATYRLFQAMSKRGNYKKAVYYVNQHLNYGDSIRDLNSTAEVKKIQSLYNYNHFMRGRNELIMENKAKEQIIYIIIIGGLIVAFSGFVFVHMQKKAKDDELAQKQHLLDVERMKTKNDKDLLSKNKSIIVDLQKQLNEALLDAEKTKIEEQKSRLENDNLRIEQRQKAEKEFKVSEIYQYVHSCDEKLLKLNDADWDEIKKWLDSVYDDFTMKLNLFWPQLNPTEYHLCCLIKMKVSVKRIAIIEAKESNTISSARSRLYTKYTGKKGDPKLFDEMMAAL
jgi:tetratricopeptide (TPR) repeat protein